MSRQTGGIAFGATSTRSSPRSRAIWSASNVGMTPTCSPFSSISRTSRIRMRSLMRVWTGLEITCLHYPLPGIATTQERAGDNLRRGRHWARDKVYHRFEPPVNQFVAFGRRFSPAPAVPPLLFEKPSDAQRLNVAGFIRKRDNVSFDNHEDLPAT